ncbi:MAG: antibiotic biosynthesis monooxygenase [Dehalococcoidia bacterium]
MKIVRTTLVRPRPGFESQVAALLRDLDDSLAKQPGFLESYEVEEEPGQIGRVALWESREAADRAAKLDHTIAVRARLHSLSRPHGEEHLMAVTSEKHARPLEPAGSA